MDLETVLVIAGVIAVGLGIWIAGFAISRYCSSVEHNGETPDESTSDFYTEEQKFKIMNAFLKEAIENTSPKIIAKVKAEHIISVPFSTSIIYDGTSKYLNSKGVLEVYNFRATFTFDYEGEAIVIPIYVEIYFNKEFIVYKTTPSEEGYSWIPFKGEFPDFSSLVINSANEQICNITSKKLALRWYCNVLQEKTTN